MRVVKTFEDFENDEYLTDDERDVRTSPDVSWEEDDAYENHVEQREHGFYWVVIQGNMTIAEWVHDEDAGDFWLAHGESDSEGVEVEEILQFIEPPVNDEYDEEAIEPIEPVS